jgi:thiazole synthase ThiGH ThiG subunit
VTSAESHDTGDAAGWLARSAGRIPVRRYPEASSTHAGRID